MKQQIISFISFTFFVNCFINSPVLAQTTNKTLEKKIVVTGKQITIDSLLRIFSRQTTMEFSFNSKKISPQKKVTVPKQSLTIFQWLQNLKREVNIEYKFVGNHLVLLDRAAKLTPAIAKSIVATTNTGKKNIPLLAGNKMHDPKIQNNYSAANNGILQTVKKNEVSQKETVKKDADSSLINRIPQVQDTTSTKKDVTDTKMITRDTAQTKVVNNTEQTPSPVTLSSSDTIATWDFKHQLTLTPGIPILELGKYYRFSVGLDYDRKLVSFGRTKNKNNTAWKPFNLNLELGADYIFDKDSTRHGDFLVLHLFPNIQYKLGQYAHIDVGAGLAGLLPSPGAHLGYGVNLSVNFPVTRQRVLSGGGNAFNKIILLGAGIEMYEFSPYDALFLGTLRLTMLFPGKKR